MIKYTINASNSHLRGEITKQHGGFSVTTKQSTGLNRIEALEHFVANFGPKDHMLMLDDDDSIVWIDEGAVVPGRSIFDSHAQDRPAALWGLAICYEDARYLLERFEHCCFDFSEFEDQFLMAALNNRWIEKPFIRLKEQRCYHGYRKTRMTKINPNTVDAFCFMTCEELRWMFERLPTSAIWFEPIEASLTEQQILALITQIGWLNCQDGESARAVLNRLITIIRDSDVRMLIPFQGGFGFRIERGAPLEQSNQPVVVIRMSSKKDKDFVEYSHFNYWLYRLRHPENNNLQCVEVFNGPATAGFDVALGQELAVSHARWFLTTFFKDEVAYTWCDGDDQVDFEALGALQAREHPNLLRVSSAVHCDGAGSRSINFDSNKFGYLCHWNYTLAGAHWKDIMNKVHSQIKECTGYDGVFFLEDWIFGRAADLHMVSEAHARPVIWRCSFGSANSTTEWTYEQWFERFGKSLIYITKAKERGIYDEEEVRSHVWFYLESRVHPSMVHDDPRIFKFAEEIGRQNGIDCWKELLEKPVKVGALNSFKCVPFAPVDRSWRAAWNW